MDKLNARDLPTFYEYEHNLIQGQNVDMKDLCSLITEKGTIEDKIRFVIICSLLTERECMCLGRMFPDAADGNKECINEVMNKVEQVKMKTSTTESQSSMTDAFDDNL